MTNTKHRNRHGRIGTRGPRKPLTGGQVHKKFRRANTHPHHQGEHGAALETKRYRRRLFEGRRLRRRHDYVRPPYNPLAGLPDLAQVIKQVDMKAAMEGATLRMETQPAQINPAGMAKITGEQYAESIEAERDADQAIEQPHWLDTKDAAARIGMSVGYVKDHGKDLGGVKHGLRWRFDPAVLDERWANRSR